jgi:hypothetical protein
MRGWECNAARLAPLQGLSGLHTLHLSPSGVESVATLHLVCQLTGLRELTLQCNSAAEGLQLQQLTALKQLTLLFYSGSVGGVFERLS